MRETLEMENEKEVERQHGRWETRLFVPGLRGMYRNITPRHATMRTRLTRATTPYQNHPIPTTIQISPPSLPRRASHSHETGNEKRKSKGKKGEGLISTERISRPDESFP